MVRKKTQAIEDLVEEVLATIPIRGRDIIDQVCLAIENNSEWHRRYDDTVAEFGQRMAVGRDTVNNWIAKYTSRLTGMSAVTKGTPAKSTIIQSYSELQ